MLVDIYLYKRDGYSSRRISFVTPTDVEVISQRDVNFNENDQIDSSVIINGTSGTGTYLEVFPKNSVFTKDVALSHWFVVSYERVIGSNTQCRLRLRRDVIRDYGKPFLSQSNAYIAKGTIGSTFSPFLFNKEDISLNQIKTSETLLKDETGMKWIVGYVPRNWPEAKKTISVDFGPVDEYDIEVNDISTLYEGNVYGIKDAYVRLLVEGKDIRPAGPGSGGEYVEINSAAGGWKGMDGNIGNIESLQYSSAANTYTNAKYIRNIEVNNASFSLKATFNGAMKNVDVYDDAVDYVKETKQYDYVDKFDSISRFQRDYSGKRVKDKATGNVYLISVSTEETKDERDINVIKETLPSTFNAISSKIQTSFNKNAYGVPNSEPFQMDNSPGSDSFLINVSWARFSVAKTKLVKSVKVEIEAASTRTHLSDSPYDMFTIPVGKYMIRDGDAIVNPTNEELAMAITNAIDADLGKDVVYDFQLLPYCPVREYIRSELYGVATANPKSYYYLDFSNAKKSAISDDTTTYSYLVWCSTSNFSFNIPLAKEEMAFTNNGITTYKQITLYHATGLIKPTLIYAGDKFDYPDEPTISLGSTPLDIKARNQCDMLRLCSPNYSGAFEFSSQANNGVRYINVDCSYKPFNPYIHLNPDFGGLYGSDFNDQRGLVCSGDYSLARLTSAWAEYELNNKNYQSVFDRQIQNLEIQQKYQRIGDIVGGIAGVAGASAGGAAAGAITSVGALPGAVVSGALSGIGAIADYKINEALREEAMSYKKDMYNYSLGNIKALPYGLAKTTSFNLQNKVWPFLEYYTCTKEEKDSFANKLKYNGMTIGAFGKIIDFVPNDGEYHFIQGTLPYIPLTQGNQIYLAVKQELEQGIYLKGEEIQ